MAKTAKDQSTVKRMREIGIKNLHVTETQAQRQQRQRQEAHKLALTRRRSARRALAVAEAMGLKMGRLERARLYGKSALIAKCVHNLGAYAMGFPDGHWRVSDGWDNYASGWEAKEE